MQNAQAVQLLSALGMLLWAVWRTARKALRTPGALATLADPREHASCSMRPAGRDARKLGRYVLAEKIGQGAMGEVYRAWDPSWARWCAIKLLPPDAEPAARARFQQEAQLTARLCHPNTVSLYDYGSAADGTSYYAMELLEGVSLQRLIEREGPQPPARVIPILLQLCGALREAHRAGIVHRDLKPDNVMLCHEGGVADFVKLVDFGLAERIDRAPPAAGTQLVVGTPLYMAPEAFSAPEIVSPQSDLYALGAVAYFLLSGKPLFDGRSVIEICSHHLHSQPTPLSVVSPRRISRELEQLVFACLAKDACARPASADELAGRLARCADAHVVRTERPRSWKRPARSRAARVHDDTLACSMRTLEVLAPQRACA